MNSPFKHRIEQAGMDERTVGMKTDIKRGLRTGVNNV